MLADAEGEDFCSVGSLLQRECCNRSGAVEFMNILKVGLPSSNLIFLRNGCGSSVVFNRRGQGWFAAYKNVSPFVLFCENE